MRNESLHDAPADYVSYGAETEDDEVACLLTLEAHETESFWIATYVCEEEASANVDEERTDSACHAVESCNGGYCVFGEQIGTYAEQVC